MIRLATADELGFVRETCCKVRRPRGEAWGTWEAEHGPLVDAWLREGVVQVYAADEAPDIVLGFAVGHQRRLVMLYVKRDFRGAGIGRQLLEGMGVLYPSGQLVCWKPTPSLRVWATGHALTLVQELPA